MLLQYTTLFLLASPLVVSAKRFNTAWLASCDHTKFIDGHFIEARCNDTHNVPRRTRMDMNRCITNKGGNLIFKKNGDAFTTCGSCSMDPLLPSVIICACQAGPRAFKKTSIDTNGFMANYDGRLECCGFQSWREDENPPEDEPRPVAIDHKGQTDHVMSTEDQLEGSYTKPKEVAVDFVGQPPHLLTSEDALDSKNGKTQEVAVNMTGQPPHVLKFEHDD